MPETVGNEANYYKNYAPEIDLGIKLLATQMVDESDSFGSDYDADASLKEAGAFENLELAEFTVSSESDLLMLQNLVFNGNTFEDKTITLENDITLSQANWTPIGTAIAPFKGTFDGNNKTISGLTITEATGGKAGLFGEIENATIKNLTVSGTITLSGNISGDMISIGGICANSCEPGLSPESSTIDNCINNVTIDVTGVENTDAVLVGGIVGVIQGNGGKITNCTNNGNISASSSASNIIVGAIAAMNSRIVVDNNKNTGTITGGITMSEDKLWGVSY